VDRKKYNESGEERGGEYLTIVLESNLSPSAILSGSNIEWDKSPTSSWLRHRPKNLQRIVCEFKAAACCSAVRLMLRLRVCESKKSSVQSLIIHVSDSDDASASSSPSLLTPPTSLKSSTFLANKIQVPSTYKSCQQQYQRNERHTHAARSTTIYLM
jgi:hypothetical protein